jgi:erythromycin esterase-like protein
MPPLARIVRALLRMARAVESRQRSRRSPWGPRHGKETRLMPADGTSHAQETVRRAAHPLTGAATDLDPILQLVGDTRFVLLGEASHGTAEFYAVRAEITRRLIVENGFTAVAIEGDWPDSYNVNRYVRGASDARNADEALAGFERYPVWMWRNHVVLDFVEWLRQFNDAQTDPLAKVGFYGLDLYSLYNSIDAVLRYLEQVDPAAAQRARERYSCFEHFHQDSQRYGYATTFGGVEPCEADTVAQLVELREHAAQYMRSGTLLADDEYFFAEQNALVARDAEEYYRTMFYGNVSSWNLRDKHMARTLNALATHLERTRGQAKIVVWEHNSHIGDARATELGAQGEVNVGQLMREHHGRETCLIGFTTYQGEVTATANWDELAQRKQVRPALSGSYEALFHEVGIPRFILPLQSDQVGAALRPSRLERAIGVVYRPESERLSHYFFADLPAQFDAIIHIDETSAVQPLEDNEMWVTGEAPETYPFAL